MHTPMTMPEIDLNTVAQYVSDVAHRDIMPAFQNLQSHQIYEKRPGEIVTEIDVIAEKHLSELLCTYIPGSRVLGEECSEDDPELMDLCRSDGPVWVIDPIDGTQNYSKGNPNFAMMVTYRYQQKSCAAWIHDPVNDLMYTAKVGEGAWQNDRKLQCTSGAETLSNLVGSLGNRLSKAHRQAAGKGVTGLPTIRDRMRCCGQEYMALAREEIQFLQYGVRLKPWDHAPGVLLATEAGFYAAFLGDEAPYDASTGVADGYLLIAPSRESWLGLKDALWDIQD